jgi:ribonucleoside-diphosphate reductase alpha chain
MKVDEQLVQISKRRGGTGIDLSNLRPDGAPTKNSSRKSTGIIPFMERYSRSIREVGQDGRRGALMITLSIHHPQVLDFINIKNDKTKVTGANISVRLSNEFLDAVESDSEYELRWPVDSKEPAISKMVKAREVWNQLISNAHAMAEPGLLFWDNITKNSPCDCYEAYKSNGTNPCSELNLAPLDSCRLLALNLYSYVIDPFTEKAYFDYELFKQHSCLAQRLMDDLVDLEAEKIKKIVKKIKSDPESEDVKSRELEMWKRILKMNCEGRRTGTGITALGDATAALGIKYASEQSIELTGNIYKTLKLSCYRSSVDMAKELGTFVGYDASLEINNPFIQRIKSEDETLYEDMLKFGRRNVSLTTTAPTGSVSLLTQTTSGIEPLFMISYTRRKKINPSDEGTRVDFVDQSGDSWQNYTVYHSKVKDWMNITGNNKIEESPWFGCCAEDLDWNNRVKLQANAQLHVCHSISSTINLPEDVDVNTVAQIYETAWKSGCKGMTIYRKNCRTGVLVEESKEKEPSNKIIKTKAPKRPDDLPCDVYHTTIKGVRYYAVVGIYNGDVYEVFTGMNHDSEGEIIIPKTVVEGEAVKIKRGNYILVDKETKKEYTLTNGHSDPNADALTRMISTGLRHGTDVAFIVHQLEKTKGDLQCFAKVLSRVLKKYVADGTKVSGETCANCGSSNIERMEGCLTCKDCGNSKCS